MVDVAIPAPHADPRGFLRALFDAAVARALPEQVMGDHLPHPPQHGRTLVLGAGKAAAAMAAAFESRWPAGAPLSGLVVTRYGHVPPAVRGVPSRIEVMEAAHPVPDAASLRAAERMVALTQGLGPEDLVVGLFSGGGSALMVQPASGVTLAEKQAVHRALVASGASIEEINTVRKHLSAVKGGRLGARCAPARVVTLLISDVPGDAADVVASGPTVPDPSCCADALAVVRRYGIALGPQARAGLESGALETPKPGDPRLDSHRVQLIATPRESLLAAAALARRAGVPAHVLSDAMEGDARTVGQVHAALARSVARQGEPFTRPCVLLSGGETTVAIAGLPEGHRGRGGRASEFLLATALALQGQPGVHALAADTDGIDGVGHNAGALLGPDTLARARAAGLDARRSLDRHDAAGFFDALGDLVVTGPTFTNVNDFRALLVL